LIYISNENLFYPIIPFVLGKGIHPVIHTATDTLNIVFETSKSKSGSIKLTPEQFEKFKALLPDIKGFTRCVRENILPPDALLIDNGCC
jgi:hypothetical protein